MCSCTSAQASHIPGQTTGLTPTSYQIKSMQTNLIGLWTFPDMYIASAALKLLPYNLSAAHFSRIALMLNKDAPKGLSCNIQAHLQKPCFTCQHADYTNDTQILYGPNHNIAAAHARQGRCDMLHHGK